MPPTLPKLSYVLLSHNREKYIRAAIESAFAQDYEGELEYIFSDDCSTDRTFEIIKECVAAYKGNRRVVVTQTPRNLRLAEHTNYAISYATGEWIIRADDDDISSLSRCQIIGCAILRYPNVKFIATSYLNFKDAHVDEIYKRSSLPVREIESEYLCSIFDHKLSTPLFANKFYFKAWHIDVYRQFEALPQKADYVDDYFCYHRGCILGPALYITSSPLVFARIDCGNQSLGEYSSRNRGYRSIIAHEQFVDRYFNTSCKPMHILYDELVRYTQKHFTNEQKKISQAFLSSLKEHVKSYDDYRYFWRKGMLYRYNLNIKYGNKGFFNLIRCLPLPVFAAVLSFLRMLKETIQIK